MQASASSFVCNEDTPSIERGGASLNALVKSKRKKKKSKRRALYDQYRADSGSESSFNMDEVGDEALSVYQFEEYEPGMDINILIQQTVQNALQSVILEDYDGTSQFSDYDLVCFSAAIKHNSSILSLQMRYLDVSDTSIVPLCRSLEHHPCIRALDLSGTRGGNASSKAIIRLVCSNPNILFVRLEDTMVSPGDAEEILLATKYNALACPDPTNNPFHLGLLQKIGAMEEEEQKYKEQLEARPWLFGALSENSETNPLKKVKKIGFAEKMAKSRIGAEICAQFMSGRCNYGSRCRYIHPDKTVALQNAIAVSQYKNSLELEKDTKSLRSACSYFASGSKTRLQSRLRPAHFSLSMQRNTQKVRLPQMKTVDLNGHDDDDDDAPLPTDPSFKRAIWLLSATVVLCSSVVAFVY